MNKINPKLKIIIGSILMLAGLFGAKLTCQGAKELGKLDTIKLDQIVEKQK